MGWGTNVHRTRWLGALLLWLAIAPAVRAQDTLRFAQTPLRTVIETIQDRTAYRLLYRDALISGKIVSLETTLDDLPHRLPVALRPVGIAAAIDTARRQIVLTELAERPEPEAALIQGQVVDAETGARLPYATITWLADGRLRGVAADEAGRFRITLGGLPTEPSTITASYLGYVSQSAAVDGQLRDITLRLDPETLYGQEVVVAGMAFASDVDTALTGLLRPDLHAPFGEQSIVRALQPLPSVTLSGAMSDGLHVRGSAADAFQVLLDGVTIYNQQHFFGLFDVFNADALQTVGFFYDVVPADYVAPPGGTLSFMTRTGSQTGFRAEVGASNAAVRGTAEGPLRGGKGSWLLSGRHSYLNALSWFNNADLIAQGMGFGRETSALPAQTADPTPRLVRLGGASARFYDVHGKIYDEGVAGRRLMLNLYAGGNRTRQDAERVVRLRDEDRPQLGWDRETVVTATDWGNWAGSVQLQQPLGTRHYARTTVALSHYRSEYAKDDFAYPRPLTGRNPEPGEALTKQRLAPFAYENTLTEVKLAQHVDLAGTAGTVWGLGATVQQFGSRYEEQSALGPVFGIDPRATQADLYGQVEWTRPGLVHLRAGMRSHYYTAGGPGRRVWLSPRVQVGIRPGRPASFSLGYSRNYQFLHRIYLQNTNSANIWVLTSGRQQPSQAHNLTAGLYLRLTASTRLQVEGYWKAYADLRQHEVNAPARTRTRLDNDTAPWLFDLDGFGRGLEGLLQQRLGRLQATMSYTLARMELRHPLAFDGAWFRADWDQTHQVMATLQARLGAGWEAHLAWMYGSGTPNVLAYEDPSEPALLAPYHRLDASVQYRRPVGSGAVLHLRAALFNVYDRDNPWYRTPTLVVDLSDRPIRQNIVNVDVYDLGLQPSFDVSFTF